jgi:protein-S-isoprenylcysteine O-methyltransferase Ste14
MLGVFRKGLQARSIGRGWVRNPLYLGALLVLVGFGLWHASLAMVLLALPALTLAHLFVVLYEEPTLRRRFGLPYVAYLARVNRWIPTPLRGNSSQSEED